MERLKKEKILMKFLLIFQVFHFLIFIFSYMNGERLSCSEADEMLNFSLAEPGSE